MQKKQMLLFLAFFLFQTQGKRVFLIQNTPSTSFRTHAHPHRKMLLFLLRTCLRVRACVYSFISIVIIYNSILIKLSEKPGVDLLLRRRRRRRRRFPTVSLSFALCFFFFFLCFTIFFVHHHPDQRDGSGRAPAGGLHDGRSV